MPYTALFTTARGIEEIVAQELKKLGGEGWERWSERSGWVKGKVDSPLTLARLCYCARTIHRGVLVLVEGTIRRTEEGLGDLYELVKSVDWTEWLTPTTTFCVRANRHGRHQFQSPDIERVSGQAVIDRILEQTGNRQRVRLTNPDVLVRVEVAGETCVIGIDFVGEEALHRRGYRVYDHPAALSPVLAAAMVLMAQWSPKERLLDPMCGSGTILIEAALFARKVPGGFFRKERFAFRSLPYFSGVNFDDLLLEWDTQAEWQVRAPLFGSDLSPKHIGGAQQNAERALVADTIEWQVMDAAELPQRFPKGSVQCLMSNPPFGVRSGSPARAREAHRLLLQVGHEVLSDNGRIAIITPHPEWLEDLAPYLDFTLVQRHEVLHGDLPAAILLFRRANAKVGADQTEVHRS